MPQEFSGDLTTHALKVLTVEQVRHADKQTLSAQGIASIDLMERAAARALEVCLQYIGQGQPVDVVCGTGNNGGDGLAMARMLHERGYPVRAFVLGDSEYSPDCRANAERLRSLDASLLTEIRSGMEMPALTGSVVVDALFGTGLTRTIEGLSAQAILAINRSGVPVFSIDLPSGMMADSPLPEGAPVVKATRTVTFQAPKLCFFFPMSARCVGEWTVIDIGLDAATINSLDSRKYFVTRRQVAEWVHPRPKFSHKGNFGHAWLAAGSRGMMGAAVLSGLACLKSGAGLLTMHVPRSGVDILQASLPEALVQADTSEDFFSGMTDAETQAATALAAGPGLSTDPDVHDALRGLIQARKPLLLDADALNILSLHKEWLTQLPGHTVLT